MILLFSGLGWVAALRRAPGGVRTAEVPAGRCAASCATCSLVTLGCPVLASGRVVPRWSARRRLGARAGRCRLRLVCRRRLVRGPRMLVVFGIDGLLILMVFRRDERLRLPREDVVQGAWSERSARRAQAGRAGCCWPARQEAGARSFAVIVGTPPADQPDQPRHAAGGRLGRDEAAGSRAARPGSAAPAPGCHTAAGPREASLPTSCQRSGDRTPWPRAPRSAHGAVLGDPGTAAGAVGMVRALNRRSPRRLADGYAGCYRFWSPWQPLRGSHAGAAGPCAVSGRRADRAIRPPAADDVGRGRSRQGNPANRAAHSARPVNGLGLGPGSSSRGRGRTG